MIDAADTPRGRIVLVGAGPGAPDLITLRGLAALRSADVVLHDRLAPRALLDEAPPGAECIDVGKHPGRPTPSQPWINDLLIEHARRGRTVVRLKGGDPFVFGRGYEEVQAAAAAGIPVEVIPGVTAGVAVPAAAGIPLTTRGMARAVAFVTAVTDWDHPANDGRESQIDTVAAVDTICVFMGLSSAGAVAARLVERGRDPSTPVAAIAGGCTARQRVVLATLGDLADVLAGAALRSPVLLVIGEVARCAERAAACAAEVAP